MIVLGVRVLEYCLVLMYIHKEREDYTTRQIDPMTATIVEKVKEKVR